MGADAGASKTIPDHGIRCNPTSEGSQGLFGLITRFAPSSPPQSSLPGIHQIPAMTASQMRIAETIDAFYGDAGANDGVSRSYKQAVEDLDAETIKALDGPFRYIEPPPTTPPANLHSLHCLPANSPTQTNGPRTHLPLLRLLP